MYHLLLNANRDIKRRENKYKDSRVYTPEYRCERNQTVKPWWARLQTQHQALTLSPIELVYKSEPS